MRQRQRTDQMADGFDGKGAGRAQKRSKSSDDDTYLRVANAAPQEEEEEEGCITAEVPIRNKQYSALDDTFHFHCLGDNGLLNVGTDCMGDEDGLNLAERIGRFTDRSGLGRAAINAMSGSKIAFKSKVVSKAHVEGVSAEDIYKSVKIRIELGREWQAGANAFK
ncbi:hypothetical protein DFH07DRAFT_966846 [Mycena maculata]|uniref:Uncharacterized protein n=1 Tax=Mycena maculata TaxID=230809 RepID=A0AAD7I6R9_9AGAR|nr:hypothetical protein DFH07DRAFT_966846 [Mycena maculata]